MVMTGYLFKKVYILVILYVICLAIFFLPGSAISTMPDAISEKDFSLGQADPGMFFVKNVGQAAPDILFYGTGRDGSIFFTKNQIIFKSRGDRKSSVIYLKPVGMSPDARVAGIKPTTAKFNYLIGDNPDHWHSNVSSFEEVVYHDLYPGIDLKFYTRGRQFEYDVILRTQGDLENMLFEVSGASDLDLTDAGALLIKDSGTVCMKQKKPYAYQLVHDKRVGVDSRFFIAESANGNAGIGIYGFTLGEYNPSSPVVIDPVVEFSTFFGGSKYDFSRGIGLDTSGNIIVAGYTESIDFQYSAGLQEDNGGGRYDCFVSKFSSDGSTLIFSTYFGGSDDDQVRDLAVDNLGNTYVTGFTNSSDFPVNSALYPQKKGHYDAFLTRISSAGNSILFSTFIGGSEYDAGYGIAVDSTNNPVITGTTYSSDFPTQSPLFASLSAFCDVFVCKINIASPSIIYSTYIPGSRIDKGYDIAVDASGNAYVTGMTNSPDFPLQNEKEGYWGMAYDAFVSKISPTGSTLVYSTYIASFFDAYGKAIAVDSKGCAWVTGMTMSTDNMATPNALYGKNSGDYDVFVTKVNTTGNEFLYSTYLGGSDYDAGHAIAIDGSNNVYILGETTSSDFPVTDAPYTSFAGDHDLFVTSLDSTGTTLKYSTYIGGTGLDIPYGIAADSAGNVFIAGVTKSTTGFPIINAYDATFNGLSDVFIIRLDQGTE